MTMKATADPKRCAIARPRAMSRPALSHRSHQTFSGLHTTAGNRTVQRLLTSLILRQPDKGGDKPPKKGDTKKEEPKKVDWSRTLVGDPRLLDGKHASFDVFFDHVLPDVPKGRKQMWQVVENARGAHEGLQGRN